MCSSDLSPIDTEISPTDLCGVISDDQAQESSFREAELWTAIELCILRLGTRL